MALKGLTKAMGYQFPLVSTKTIWQPWKVTWSLICHLWLEFSKLEAMSRTWLSFSPTQEKEGQLEVCVWCQLKPARPVRPRTPTLLPTTIPNSPPTLPPGSSWLRQWQHLERAICPLRKAVACDRSLCNVPAQATQFWFCKTTSISPHLCLCEKVPRYNTQSKSHPTPFQFWNNLTSYLRGNWESIMF